MLQAYKQLNMPCSSGLVPFFTWRNQQFFLTQSFLKDSSEAKTKSGLLSLLIILPDVLLITYLITASIYNTMYLILSHYNIITYLFEHHHYLCPEQKWTSKSIAGVQATNIWTVKARTSTNTPVLRCPSGARCNSIIF